MKLRRISWWFLIPAGIVGYFIIDSLFGGLVIFTIYQLVAKKAPKPSKKTAYQQRLENAQNIVNNELNYSEEEVTNAQELLNKHAQREERSNGNDGLV